MFEIPEYVTIAKQMNEIIKGKVIKDGFLGNSPHKFVWYNQTPEAFTKILKSKSIGTISTKGRWLFITIEPGYVLVFGECGGKIIFHETTKGIPEKYHMLINFTDGTSVTAMTQMWGAMELYRQGEEQNRQYVKDMRITPVEKGFTYVYFKKLLQESTEGTKRSAKSLLTQDQLLPGLGNSIAQDILLKAGVHPKADISKMSEEQKRVLYETIKETLKEAIRGGGRDDEYDFRGNLGKYKRLLDKESVKNGCPICGSVINKIQYLGGASYYCNECQKL